MMILHIRPLIVMNFYVGISRFLDLSRNNFLKSFQHVKSLLIPTNLQPNHVSTASLEKNWEAMNLELCPSSILKRGILLMSRYTSVTQSSFGLDKPSGWVDILSTFT